MHGALDTRSAARALGGDAYGRNQVVCPGPGHSPRDRSLSVTFNSTAPEGFLVFSHASDDPLACRDHVRSRLGLPEWQPASGGERPLRPLRIRPQVGPDPDREAKMRLAVAIWNEAVEPAGTPVEAYLASRGLELGNLGGGVLRYAPACPWRDHEQGRTIRVPAMVAPMRDIRTNEVRAVHRTLLTLDGKAVVGSDGVKLRRWLGDALGCVIKLDGDDDVAGSLTLGEGIETVASARQLGIRPAWATGSVSTLGTFPVLPGVECLSLLAEADKKGANAKAIARVGSEWHAAGREVVVIKPRHGGDANDALRASLGIGEAA
jgi:putative DNA primase/helicase